MPAQQGNNLSISQIRDGLINPNFTTPLYVSETSFTVAGDVTSWLRPGRGLVITFQTSGVKRGAVRNVFYDSGTNKSTINVIGDSLVNEPITSVLISLSDMEGAFSKFDPNLVLYLPLEEGTGTMTKDLSGWGNHGTLVNGPTWTNGRVGKCLSFDGVDDYVYTTNQFTNPQTFSITTWFKTSSASGHKIIGFENVQTGTGCTNYDRHLYVGTDGKLYFVVYDGETRVISTSITVTDNNWHFAVATFSSNTMNLYLDGNVVGSLSTGRAQNYNGWWRIGSYKLSGPNATNGYFSGLIDEVRIYNRALSESEIQDHYLNP